MTKIDREELCPSCGQKIILKPTGDSLMCFELNGTVHKCPRAFEPKPLGQRIAGRTIQSFHLKQRIATLILSDNMVLEISAARGDDLVAMNLRLVASDGIIEEKG